MSFFIMSGPVDDPAAGDKARSTVDAAERVADERPADAPEWGEVDTDSGGDLVGLSPRQQPGHFVRTGKYAPGWLAEAGYDYTAIIDGQVSSSGTAAAREAAGEFGHGTMSYTESIDPVIRDGMVLGEVTFEVTKPPVQVDAPDSMQAVPGHAANAVSGMLAVTNAKNAWQSGARLTSL